MDYQKPMSLLRKLSGCQVTFKYLFILASKAQSSTIGFSSSTGNTTVYSKNFADAQLGGSRYAPSGDQSTITRSSFYK
jgi:hypothetical protein